MKLLLSVIAIALILSSVFAASSNYSLDGTNNNQQNPNWGKEGEKLIRKVPVVYADKIGEPVGGNPSNLPSTRLISNLLFARTPEPNRKVNKRLVTDILTFWGQFLDHDLDFSPDSNNPCVPFSIPVPRGDPIYDPNSEGGKTMRFCRTIHAPDSGNSEQNPRDFPNVVTPWLDGSAVYGHTVGRAQKLRTGVNGLLKSTMGPDGELPPINTDGDAVLIPMANPANRVPAGQLYAVGDPRGNENPVLLALHTLFVREHNRRARALSASLSDEQRYQEARRWVIGHMQAITVNEYFPTLTGTPFPPYKGYNSSMNPQVSAFFSTVAFRYGHDEVNSVITRLRNDGQPITEGPILLRDCYFWPPAVANIGIGPYLRGAATNPQHDVDGMLAGDMRNFLFGQVPPIATDLAARNLQRGRDHGIARYNDCRRAYGLPTINTYNDLTSDPEVIKLLTDAYGPNNVTHLDPYICGLLEPKAPTTNLGPLFTAAITEQLVRIRDGDRFWFERDGVFTPSELAELRKTTLADIILRNTDTKHLPKDVFKRADASPAVILGATNRNMTGWIIGIIIPSVVAAILIIVVIGLLFSRKKVDNGGDNQLYTNLLENDQQVN